MRSTEVTRVFSDLDHYTAVVRRGMPKLIKLILTEDQYRALLEGRLRVLERPRIVCRRCRISVSKLLELIKHGRTGQTETKT